MSKNQKTSTQNSMQNLDHVSFDNKIQRKQIAAIAFVAVIAILIIIFGFWRMGDILDVPLVGTNLTYDDLQAADSGSAYSDPNDPAVLKVTDTDEDGLNDFEELYVYETSPYLADSDSDGIDDIEEIKALEDPNCPRGQECFRTAEFYEGEPVVEAAGEEAAAVDTAYELTPQQIRALLAQSGQFTADQLGQFTDQELLDLYQQLLVENPTLKAEMEKAAQGESTTVDANPVAAAKNLSADEIKALLLKNGVEQSVLDSVDEATLIQMYQGAFAEAEQKMNNN